MQKRLLMSFAFIALFMILWGYLGSYLGYSEKSEQKPVETEVEKLSELAETRENLEQELPKSGSQAQVDEPENPSEEVVEADIAQEFTYLENDELKLMFDNQGGVLKSAVLKNFYNTAKQQDRVNLVFAFDNYPGQLLFDGVAEPRRYGVENLNRRTLIYRGKNPQGQQVIKKWELGDKFKLRYTVEINGQTSPFLMVIAEGLEPISPGEKLKPSLLSMGAINPKLMMFTWSEEGDHEHENIGDQSRDKFSPLLEEEKDLEWLGIKDNYFANVFMPDEKVRNGFVHVKDVHLSQDAKPIAIPAMAMEAQDSFSGEFYLGPLLEHHLKGADTRLENLIDYGFMGVISKWLFVGLKGFHSITNNWGWSIILLTLVIRLCLVPITIPQMKSSFKMRALAPKIEKLKAKYGGDDLEGKQKLSQETFKLYKEEGVNPFSSCITALAQMPVFFAYFSLLRSSIFLRQAEWMIWIDDLSVRDTTFILPILMGVTMFFSTMAMPMPSADPSQQKMMKYMPVMFSLMFMFMPSGLILYMITSNLFTLVQNRVMKRRYDT